MGCESLYTFQVTIQGRQAANIEAEEQRGIHECPSCRTFSPRYDKPLPEPFEVIVDMLVVRVIRNDVEARVFVFFHLPAGEEGPRRWERLMALFDTDSPITPLMGTLWDPLRPSPSRQSPCP